MINAESCREKLEAFNEGLERVQIPYRTLVEVLEAKEATLLVMEETSTPEEIQKMRDHLADMRAKATYAKARIDVMTMSRDYVQKKYEEMMK